MMKRWLLALVAAAGCGDAPYNPMIEPARFVTGVDNAFFPLVPGTVYEYDVLETDETVTVTVTADTKIVMGVTCMVVRDIAKSGGQVVEDTYDWYAQDDAGTVWYFGEDTTAFDGGQSSKEGSWEGGVDGAKPGIIIPGTPRVGAVYRQEYYAGEAEDQGEILSLDAAVTVPYMTFTGGCLKTRDFTALEPDVEEHKYYCPGVGPVRAEAVKGGPEHEDLITVTRP